MQFSKATSIIVYVGAAIVLIFALSKVALTYHYTHENWHVKSVNYGFVIVQDEDKEHELLARNPVVGLKPGTLVEVGGFDYFNQELPYVRVIKTTK